jgi:cytochrome oxidase Cu insertion factor (SCO1/SenC/PrrC family)
LERAARSIPIIGLDRRGRQSCRVYANQVPLKDGDYTMDHTAVVYLMDKKGHARTR